MDSILPTESEPATITNAYSDGQNQQAVEEWKPLWEHTKWHWKKMQTSTPPHVLTRQEVANVHIHNTSIGNKKKKEALMLKLHQQMQ